MSSSELHILQGIRQLLAQHQGTDFDLQDDCATIRSLRDAWIATTDMLIDRVHFDVETTALFRIGRKAINASISDLAASGAKPKAVLVSLGLPRFFTNTSAMELMEGVIQATRAAGAAVVGGDTNFHDGPLCVSVTALGEPHWRGAVTRSGAKPGDALLVTGVLGASLLSEKHLDFTPRHLESQWLLDRWPIHAMMDLSDGLALDGKRLALASQVSLILDADRLPAAPLLRPLPDFAKMRHQCCDGEDFELFMAVDPRDAKQIIHEFPWPCGIHPIGTCASHDDQPMVVRWSCGSVQPIPEDWKGYEHGAF